MRPRMVCHRITAIDGCLVSDQWLKLSTPMSNDALIRLYDKAAEHFKAQGNIVGRMTMQEVLQINSKELRAFTHQIIPIRQDYILALSDNPFFIVFDFQGKLPYSQKNTIDYQILSVLTNTISDEYLNTLRKWSISCVFAGGNGNNLCLRNNRLAQQLALSTLLLEEDGVINGAFLEANLIDEFSLVVDPNING